MGVGSIVGVGVSVGVGVGVSVGVGVGVGVGVPGVGVAHGPAATKIVSTRHPVADTLLSDAIRKRSLIVCPFTFGPRFATVLI